MYRFAKWFKPCTNLMILLLQSLKPVRELNELYPKSPTWYRGA